MPRRNDLNKILVLGSGPIVIGQAAEFDYSGAQACKVLLEEGYEVVLVNSNPATIMTDPEFATATYVEPLLPGPGGAGDRARAAGRAAADARRPDRAQPGQGAARGRHARALRRGADRRDLRRDLPRRGPRAVRRDDAGGRAAHGAQHDRHHGRGGPRARSTRSASRSSCGRPSRSAAAAAASPAPPRTSTGSWPRGLAASPDRAGPHRRVRARLGRVRARGHARRRGQRGHRLLDRERRPDGRPHRRLGDRRAAADADRPPVPDAARPGDRRHPRGRRRDRRLERAVRGQPGDRRDRRHRDEPARVALVARWPPRRPGFPIAKIAARLAVGYRLDEIDNDITKRTPARFEPVLDYAVVKWPRFAFEKFPGVETRPVDAHEVGRRGHGHRPHVPPGLRQGHALARAGLRDRPLRRPARAPRGPVGRPLRPDPRAAVARRRPRRRSARAPASTSGSCASWPRSTSAFEGERTYRAVDTCAAEFEAETPYFYSAWERPPVRPEIERGDRPSVMILGSGPNRIGQGIEFDYCCVHAAMTVRESGRDAVMVNCNPETVSTDYDTSDRLYFEPLTLEDVLAIVEVEQPEGVIVQFGGQTPLKLAAGLEAAGVPLLGTQPEAIDLAEDRGRFSRAARRAGPARAAVRDRALGRGGASPPRRRSAGRCSCARATCSAGARWRSSTTSTACATTCARVNGCGRRRSSSTASSRTRSRSTSTPSATARTSGSAASCSTSRRPASTPATRPACSRRTRSGPRCSTRSARPRAGSRSRSATVGLINVQYGVLGDDLYVIEANPRASRTVPFVSKATGLPLAKLACRVMLGERLAALAPARRSVRRPRLGQGGRAPVRPLRRRRRAARPGDALDRRGHGRGRRLPDRVRQGPGGGRRAAAAGGHRLPHGDGHRQVGASWASPPSSTTSASGSSPRAGPPPSISRMGIPVERINKLGEGSPHVVDWIESGDVDLVINTPTGTAARTDGYEIRRAAVARGIPCITTIAGGMAAVAGDRRRPRRGAGGGVAAGAPRQRRTNTGIEGGGVVSQALGLPMVVYRPPTTPRPTAGRSRRSSPPHQLVYAGTTGRTRSSPWPTRRARPRPRPVLHAHRGGAVGRGSRRAAVPAARVLASCARATASSTSCSRTSARERTG